MDPRGWAFIGGVALLAVMGCANAEDRMENSLARQQSATIESLNNEILRLNQELDGMAGSREKLIPAEADFRNVLAASIACGDVRVVMDPRGIVITVLDHAIFDPDETQFTPAGEEVLAKIAAILSRELPDYRVTLEGHTDDQPIEGADGITNWEYSIGRAGAVLHYFLDVQGMAPKRFGVAGFAEFRPVASNATEEGRDRNRRVEIVITPQRVADASRT